MQFAVGFSVLCPVTGSTRRREQLVPMLSQLVIMLAHDDLGVDRMWGVVHGDARAPHNGAASAQACEVLRHVSHEILDAIAFDGAFVFELVGYVRPSAGRGNVDG